MRRLGVTCAMEQVRPGDILEQLILDRSKRWVVQDRVREGGSTETVE
jgi:hypothetical protein